MSYFRVLLACPTSMSYLRVLLACPTCVSSGSEGEVVSGEPDIFSVTFAAYMSMVETCGLATRKTPHADFEVLFAIVDAPDRATKHLEAKVVNKGGMLSRQEWLQLLVRLAIYLHVTKGHATDVSDALSLFMSDQLRPQLPPYALQSSNDFRQRVCYNERVTRVLEAHVGSLRCLFEVYAEVSHGLTDAFRDDALMSIGEFLTLWRHMVSLHPHAHISDNRV